MEVVQQLRDACMKQERVDLVGDELVFSSDGKKVPRGTATGLVSKGRGKEAYTLDALWFLVQNKDLAMRAYYEECKKQGVERVQIIDKRDVLDYLFGKVNEIAQMSKDGPGKTERLSEPATAKTESQPSERDADKLATAMAKEHAQRTRDSLLVMEGRSFKFVLDVLGKYLKKREDEKRASMTARSAETVAADPRGDRYRVDNKRFYREEMGTDIEMLGIDPSGSFKKVDRNINQSSTSRAKPERPAATPAEQPAAKKPKVAAKRKTPIIVVPGARDMKALVNLANLPILLKDRAFRSAADILKEGKAPPTPQVKHMRTSPESGEQVEYLLISNVRQIQPDDWDRVVAIICQGADWQFKDFPASMGRTPAQILSKMQGFYFHFAGDKTENIMRGSRVKMLAVNRSRRHDDMKVWSEFWRTLDDYLRSHRRSTLRW